MSSSQDNVASIKADDAKPPPARRPDDESSTEEMFRAFFNANCDDYMAYWDETLTLKLANFQLAPEYFEKIATVRESKTEIKFEAEQDGRTFNYRVYPALNALGECMGVAVFAHDISKTKAAEREVHRLAYFDSLTGLPNRTLLLDRLTQALISTKRHYHYGAVLFINLDRFKTINESLGHEIGDQVLRETAARLEECRRDEDTIARLGSDEFIWLLPELSSDAELAARFAGRAAERLLKASEGNLSVYGNDLRISPSIGIALFDSKDRNANEILKQSDIAMHRAKRAAPGTVRYYSPQMHKTAVERLNLETRLHDAVKNRMLEVYYQPQANVGNDKLVGAEVLLRWNDEKLGPVSPARFIPVAEETGLILEIGEWVLESVCQEIHDWNTSAYTNAPQRIAVNISPVQFREKGFVDGIARIMNRWDIRPGQLELELTEGIVVDNLDDTIAKMRELRELGVRLAIDDFGTGYSSLAYLNQLPVDILKIDQSFIRAINDGSNTASIVTSIITMAQLLEYDIIAEGVETREQLLFLIRHGCTTYQGFLYSKPLDVSDFQGFLHHQGHKAVAAAAE